MDTFDVLIDLEGSLGCRHICCNRERLRRAAVYTRVVPNSVQLADILAGGFAFVNLAECNDIEHVYLGGRIVHVERPAAHASIRAAHDRSRQQALELRDIGNRVRFGSLHCRTVEHGLAIIEVPIVIEHIAVLQNRSLDGIDLVILHGEQITCGVFAPIRIFALRLDRNLLLSIEDVAFAIVDFEFHIRERDILIVRRNYEGFRSRRVRTGIRRVVVGGSVSELPGECVSSLIRIGELDRLACNGGLAISPESIQRRVSCRVFLTSIKFNKERIVQFGKVLGRTGFERVTVQALVCTVQSRRELSLSTKTVASLHNTVFAIRRNGIGRSFDDIGPGIAEVGFTDIVFIKCEVVSHGSRGNVKRDIRLTIHNVERLAIGNSRRSSAVIDGHFRTDSVAISTGELHAEFHVLDSRDHYPAVCARSHLVPERVLRTISNNLINLEYALRGRHSGCYLERLRITARCTRICPDGIERINGLAIFNIIRENTQSSFIECVKCRAAGLFQSPAGQAGVRTGHDIKRQGDRRRSIINLVRIRELSRCTEEHLGCIGYVPTVSKLVLVLE